MITGWLVKLVVSIALVGFLALEIATPIFIRFQIDPPAHDAANEAGAILRERRDVEQARQVAERVAAEEQATLEAFTVDEQGRAHVTLRKQAKSYLLKKWDRFESWYDVRVTATSEGRR